MTSTTTPAPAPAVLGVGDRIAEGDTYLVENILPPELAAIAFERVKEEAAWTTMHHRGGEVPRLVAVQGEIEPDGSIPIYRHPADASPALSPFTPTVSLIRAHVEKTLGHAVNHALIQLYRTGADYISEHSDKTIDVVRGSHIANVSLGAQRTMTLRTKKDVAGAGGGKGRRVQKVPLAHNSMFAMGSETNRKWTHGVRADKRSIAEKTPAERYGSGARISLTFRRIGTYLVGAAGEERIFGRGARGKTRAEAGRVVCGGAEAEGLLGAFGEENRSGGFEWEGGYGRGFDVLHFSSLERAEV